MNLAPDDVMTVAQTVLNTMLDMDVSLGEPGTLESRHDRCLLYTSDAADE